MNTHNSADRKFRLQVAVSQPLSRGSPPGTFPPIVQDRPTLRGRFSLDQAGLTDCFILIPSGNPSTALLASFPVLSAALALRAGLGWASLMELLCLGCLAGPGQGRRGKVSIILSQLPSFRMVCTKDSFVLPQAQEHLGSLVATHPLTNWILD